MNSQSIKGILPIDKPQGWTSFDVVNKIKHLVNNKNCKIGHLGTLDPMATGVLLITLGKATKLFDIMQTKTKTYLATFAFGYETDTLDATGVRQHENDVKVNTEQIMNILPLFVGEIEQIPPKFSAKSVNGARAYDLARANKEFVLQPCKVQIYDLKIKNFANNVLTLEVVCGSGTYIRALGRDIAKKLNTFATMTSLIRTDVDKFNLKDCLDISCLTEQNLFNYIKKIKDVLLLPELKLDPKKVAKIINGQTITINAGDGLYLLNDENDTLALVKIVNFNAKMSIYLA